MIFQEVKSVSQLTSRVSQPLEKNITGESYRPSGQTSCDVTLSDASAGLEKKRQGKTRLPVVRERMFHLGSNGTVLVSCSFLFN